MASFLPNGNINPSVIVKQDTSGPFLILQASAATDKAFGVSQEGTQYAPGVLGADGLAGRAGGPGIRVFQQGEECLLTLGSGGCTAGDYLKSDASGNGVTMTFAEGVDTWYIGRALETGNAGEKVRIFVDPGVIKP